MGTADLPHSTPSAEGVSAAGVEAFLDAVEHSAQIELHSLIVLRHGRIIAEGWWSPYSADRVHLLASLSKSFTATAAAFALAEGRIDLDATVLSYFPELADEVTDPRSRAIRVRDIAAMASGHVADTITDAAKNDPDDLVRGFLLIPPERDPGTVFAYNQPCTYTLASIIQRESGQSLVDYLRPRLFDPLGIAQTAWMERPPGRNLGYSGLHATTDAIARLGQLYLQRGRWGDRQLLDPGWVDQATSIQVDTTGEPNPDWQQGYGFQFWRSRHGYRGDGAFGQFCLVLPEQEMVVAITAGTEDMQGILDAVWTHLLASVDRPDSDTEADRRLAERLATATLPVVAAQAEPDDRKLWDGARFAAKSPGAGYTEAVGNPIAPPSITEAELRIAGTGWSLTVADSGGRLDIPVTTGAWRVTESHGVPVAANGGWVDSSTLVADITFLETPHRVHVTCDGPARSLTAKWPTAPFHARSILELRKP
jgi:CubicO group peptidase (beta-lactamase class C family)